MSDVQTRPAERLERDLASRWVWALCISLGLHLLAFGTYEAGRKQGWWQRINLASILPGNKMLTEVLKKKEPVEPPPQQEEPLIFVNVDEASATPEPPKNATHYSSRNAVAANEVPANESTIPKITGSQDLVPELHDIPKQNIVPLKPSPPKEITPAPISEEELKPKRAEAPGDLALAKPEPQPHKEEGDADRPRPRTLKEVRERHPELKMPERKMKQEGGVPRAALDPGFDTMATPYGDYDAALIEAIKSHWYQLLDQRDYASESRGKVVLQFTLHFDGRVSDMSVQENTVGEVLGLICQKAILDPSPYPKWPVDMRRMLRDLRTVQFTFYYY
jgi:outer membrane biosynthesis protein TonB